MGFLGELGLEIGLVRAACAGAGGVAALSHEAGDDPKGDGTGGSQLPDVKAEYNSLPHLRGTVAAARANEPDSANSQFYIMFVPRVSLDGKYTVFGRVVSGMNFVDQIAPGEPPAEPTRIVRATLGG